MGPEEALWDSKAAFVSLVSERKCEKDNCSRYRGMQDSGGTRAKNQGRLVITDPQYFGAGSNPTSKTTSICKLSLKKVYVLPF